jgi:hypothetical protein
MCRALLFAAACLAWAGAAGAQPAAHAPGATVSAIRVTAPPSIDGRLTDDVWSMAQPADSFTQEDPSEGEPSSERTELRVVYDDEALYVGARMFDAQPAGISQRLSSRDNRDADADLIEVYLDPMHDHLTGATFRISAAGVQRDAIVFNDTWNDDTWDGVWQSAVSVDAEGWSAELRIPLSQLRFPSGERQMWGINAMRFIRRKNERAWLELVRKNENGLASRMAHLTGLDGLRPKRHVALLPYTAARAEFVQPATADNPFNDGLRGFAATGLDVKWGLTSNLTLDGTVNPDFGQVEVDPAVVNLSAFETFFEEKRPFFLEGAQTFGNFGVGGSNSFWGFNTQDPNIFYSRRIGRAPQVEASGDFVETPAATTILGAAKLTGKTRGGWSIGLLEAVTESESARTVSGAIGSRATVEPFTNYFVGRMQREVGRRAGVGFMTTAVTRNLSTPALKDALAGHAYVVGGDGYWFVDSKRDWVITGKLSGSYINGTPAMIEKAQRAAQRYFQRPDAPQVSFEPSRTSLGGYAGRINLNRNSGLAQVNAALWGVSPGFESNDLGFHGSGDRAGAHTVFFWRDVTPDRFSRARHMWAAKWWTWNYDRRLQGDGWHLNGSATFRNYWNINAAIRGHRRVEDDRLTRGGPAATPPGGGGLHVNLNTDPRRWVSIETAFNTNWDGEGGWGRFSSVAVNLKPSPQITISTGPEWSVSNALAHYVDTIEDATAGATYGSRYVFGNLGQKQLTMTTRVNLILTPRVSLQVFAQPLLAVGDYYNFKELARPRSFDFFEYGGPGAFLAYNAASEEYAVDPDAAGPAPTFTFEDPDFSLKSLRTNAVFRWELKPGSTFYAVWTRQQEDESNAGRFALGRDAAAMLRAPGDDIFLVKIAYWIGR